MEISRNVRVQGKNAAVFPKDSLRSKIAHSIQTFSPYHLNLKRACLRVGSTVSKNSLIYIAPIFDTKNRKRNSSNFIFSCEKILALWKASLKMSQISARNENVLAPIASPLFSLQQRVRAALPSLQISI